MKKFRISLLWQVLIAIVAGIVLGQFLPAPVARLFVTHRYHTDSLIIPAIADLGKGAGRLLLITALIAYGSTVFSGFFTYFTGEAIFPRLIAQSAQTATVDNPGEMALKPFFTVEMPAPFDIMTALLLSFCIGLGLSAIPGNTLRMAAADLRDIVTLLIEKVIIPLLPLHIFGIFLNMTISGQVASIISVFVKIIIVIFVLHILLLLIQFSLAGLVARKNPLRLLKNMLPAYATALGTQSSAATIPVTLAQTLKNGVSKNIATFVIPLCATIHLSGSTMKITACAMAIMMMAGIPIHTLDFSGFIFMLGITMVAAPGVPGGAIMAALGVLEGMLGFDETAQALMIALYIAMDSFGTACNVTGDGAIAVVVDRINGKSGNLVQRS